MAQAGFSLLIFICVVSKPLLVCHCLFLICLAGLRPLSFGSDLLSHLGTNSRSSGAVDKQDLTLDLGNGNDSCSAFPATSGVRVLAQWRNSGLVESKEERSLCVPGAALGSLGASLCC